LHRGRPADALPIFEDIVPRIAKALGEGHTRTLMARQSYADVLEALGRKDEAIGVMRDVIRTCDAPGSQVPSSVAEKYRSHYRELTAAPPATQQVTGGSRRR